jgi:hypothetical protein
MNRLNVNIKFRNSSNRTITSHDYVILDELINKFVNDYRKVFVAMGLKVSCTVIEEPDLEVPFLYMSQDEAYQDGDEFN